MRELTLLELARYMHDHKSTSAAYDSYGGNVFWFDSGAVIVIRKSGGLIRAHLKEFEENDPARASERPPS